MKNIFFVLLSLLPLLLFSAQRKALSDSWRFQVAENAETPPHESAWSKPCKSHLWASPPTEKSWKQKIKTADNLWMMQEFEILPDQAKDRYLLDFEQINGNLIVFINGKRVGERPGPYGKIEITDFLCPGKNVLTLFNTRNYTGTTRTFQTDFLRWAARGPHAPGGPVPTDQCKLGVNHVFLERRRIPAAIADAWTETSWRKKEIAFHVELDASTAAENLVLTCKVLDASGKQVLQFEQKELALAARECRKFILRQKWVDPVPWELDGAYLYTAQLRLCDQTGKELDEMYFPFGFREIWTEGRQVFMNGHPSRWRIEWNHFGLTRESVSFFHLLGRNVIYQQPNAGSWWRSWGDVPHFSREWLNMTDQNGIGVLLPVPSCSNLRGEFLSNRALVRQYREETAEFIRRYRRHPSVLAWCTSMNAFCPADGIAPSGIGIRHRYDLPMENVLNQSFRIVKELDSTRLVYGHAEGNLGDLASGNVYPIFAPVQEVADWPAHWARHGNMPYWASEYAAIYDGSYFKGKTFLLTEYAAVNLGPEAYRRETMRQLENTIDIGLRSSLHGQIMAEVVPYAPLYWDVQEPYITATDRAWRTWGVTAWHYFNFFVGYGNPPNPKRGIYNHWSRYADIKTPVKERPVWANRLFDLHSRWMQPLLVYLAGSPVHTDRTHSFRSGEIIRKQIAAIFDGPGERNLSAEWELRDASGKKIISGKTPLHLKAGDIRFHPIEFRAPEVHSRTEFILTLNVTGDHQEKIKDSFPLEIFPVETRKIQKTLIVFDPAGKSTPWLREMANHLLPFRSGMKFHSGDLLVIGREALKPGMKLPFSSEDLKNGLRVLLLEQRPETLEAMGFRVADTSARVVFFDRNPGVLADGLNNRDLCYWRGAANLFPEFKQPRNYENNIAPRSTNRHIVASAVMETPAVPGFEPLLSAEFDLAYTPLLRMNYGNGMLLISTLDFSGRENRDPAAMCLAFNLLRYAVSAKTEERITLTVRSGEKKEREAGQVLAEGGTVIYLALSEEELKQKNLKCERKEIRRSILSGNTPFARIFPENLLRWRDKLDVVAIHSPDAAGEGLFLLRKKGNGQECFLQLSPAMLEKRYSDAARQEAIQLSVIRLYQLLARTETFFGRGVSKETAIRVTTTKGASFRNLETWNLLGPFYTNGMSADQALAKQWPGETQALEGDLNPNHTYRTEDGRILDFRETVITDPDGRNNLRNALSCRRSNTIAYAVKVFHSETDRTAILRMGFDYFAAVYVNGKMILNVKKAHGRPKANRFKVNVPLKKGMNVIAVKLYAGSEGFAFWANLSEPGRSAEGADASYDPGVKELLYLPGIKTRNPYEFHYW